MSNGKGTYENRYPAASDAWEGGIMLYPLVQTQLPTSSSTGYNDHHHKVEFTFLGVQVKYRIVPQCVGKHPNFKVLYYIAYNFRHERSEHAISPDKLDEYLENIDTYYYAACSGFPEAPYEVGSALVPIHIMNGEWGEAWSALGRAWGAALKDPQWWAMALPATGAALMAGRSSGAAALSRLKTTQDNLLKQSVTRSSAVLKKPAVFRHTLTADVKPTSYAGIEKQGSMRISKGGNAHYGEGVYAWPKDTPAVGTYIDIEVAAGTAVETIHVNGQTYLRILSAEGNTVPVKIVGTNLTAEEIAFGRRIVGE
jgi:hypothetical protein